MAVDGLEELQYGEALDHKVCPHSESHCLLLVACLA